MSLISENLKYLRKKSNLTQEQMAMGIGIKRSLLGAYEEGRADPRISNLIKFAEFFDLSVDQLISCDLSNDDQKDKFHVRSKEHSGLKILSITVDEKGHENIELVPQKAAAGYLNGYSDPDFIEELPRFQLPVLPGNATYRAFEISGDSMLPLKNGSVVIAQYVESIYEIKNDKTYVLVTKDEGIVYKRLLKYEDNAELFCLVSDNPQYSAYDVKGEQILEIWEAKAFLCFDMPEEVKKQDMSLQKLTELVLDLQKEIIMLKKNK